MTWLQTETLLGSSLVISTKSPTIQRSPGGGVERSESSFSNFCSFLSACDLFDLKHTGNFLSWRGKRNSHLVHCRLDRAMANNMWSDMFPNGQSHYLQFEASDHRPLISTFDSRKKRSSRIFRYDRRLRDNEEITQLVKKVWNETQNSPVTIRISRCRHAISAWSKKFHTNSRKLIGETKEALDAAMSASLANDDLIAQLNLKLLKAYKAEEEFLRQRSRLLWLTLGDKNTTFFHASTKGRRARNRISVIENAEGLPVFEDDQIAETIGAYFSNIFTSSETSAVELVNKAITPCITQATNEELTKIPSPAEIRDALFAIHPDKAPGPDGFSSSFFQSNWEVVGSAITREIQSFFVEGTLPHSINSTHIRLILKIKSPKAVSDYRPIALCNVYYKVISKLLSIRLKHVLQEVISENQSAFVPGRIISDNVLITHEVL